MNDYVSNLEGLHAVAEVRRRVRKMRETGPADESAAETAAEARKEDGEIRLSTAEEIARDDAYEARYGRY